MGLLFVAVLTASLLGSLHCVGMCGPLALWASGSAESRPKREVAIAGGLYHLGRLVTYAVVGLAAGYVGQLVDEGGRMLGVQLVAARVAGVLMIVAGVVRLIQVLRIRSGGRRTRPSPSGKNAAFNIAGGQATRPKPAVAVQPRPSGVARWLASLRPYVMRLPLSARGLVVGLLTALLPCGWLYLFALVAAGTGNAWVGSLVMASFWLGSVPVLVGVVAGSALLSGQFRRAIPTVAALLLIVGGFYTAAGRGFAQLNSLADIRIAGSSAGTEAPPSEQRGSTSECTCGCCVTEGDADATDSLLQQVSRLSETPLPCCVGHSGETSVSQEQAGDKLPRPVVPAGDVRRGEELP